MPDSVLLVATVVSLLLVAPPIQATEIEGLPPEAPRKGTVVTVDVSTNQVYLFRDGELIRKSPAATGSDKILRKGRNVWWFRTPRGRYTVLRKVTDPVWTKPDWAFVEAGKPIPPGDSPLRKERGTMGKYAFDLGDRVMLHGTNDPQSIGKKATHGCIRLPRAMLEVMWKEVPVGTTVYIFESVERQIADTGLNSLDMR